MGFADRLRAVRERIAEAAARAGRDPDEVAVVAVAKTADADALREAWAAGHRRFGHNRVQPLEEHHAVLPEAEWHGIGPLQGRKVRRALRLLSVLQTVGEERTAERLERALADPEVPVQVVERRLPVLLQVNLHPEDGRYGTPPERLEALAKRVAELPHLEARGLMTLARAGADEAELRATFAGLRELGEALSDRGLLPTRPELSMGMSDDFPVAVEEGATLVRIGRALFPPPPTP